MEEGRRATGGHEGPLLHERGWPNPKIQSIDRSAVLLAACSNQKYSGLGSPRADLANPFHAQGWDGSAGGGAAWRLGHSECTHRDAHPHSALPARPPPPFPPLRSTACSCSQAALDAGAMLARSDCCPPCVTHLAAGPGEAVHAGHGQAGAGQQEEQEAAGQGQGGRQRVAGSTARASRSGGDALHGRSGWPWMPFIVLEPFPWASGLGCRRNLCFLLRRCTLSRRAVTSGKTSFKVKTPCAPHGGSLCPSSNKLLRPT